MNIIITGCAGFIGSHAVDLFLRDGHNITGVDCFTYAGKSENIRHNYDKKNFRLYNMDICKTEELLDLCKVRDIEWIINFAAETHVDNSIRSSDRFIHSNINFSMLYVHQNLTFPLLL